MIYARVPEELKDATDAFARERGMTLTNAVVDLLQRGLSAVSDADSVEALEHQVAEMTEDLAQAEGELRGTRNALQGMGTRLALRVAACPNCGGDLTGHDILVAFQCPKCHSGTGDLFAAQGGPAGVDQTDFLVFLAGIGALLGVLWLARND